MNDVVTILNGATWVFGAIGFGVAAFFIVNSGYLFITSQGDPQRVAQARHSLIGVAIGIVVIGGAFLIPGTISRFIIEPAGGVRVEVRAATDCDGILRRQLVFQRNADRPNEMQYIVYQVQNKHDGCERETWNPVVKPDQGIPYGCRESSTWEVGGVLVPETSLRASGNLINISTRDYDNNMLVYFVHPSTTDQQDRGLPSDGAVCWMYVSAFSAWTEGYLPESRLNTPYEPP